MDNATCTETESNLAYTIVIQVLTFLLVFGLAGSVDFVLFKKRFRQKGIYVGLFLQFFVLPLIGFATVSIFDISGLNALLLLVVMSSPGGSYSNWWCSLFNADLALSVAMTTVSTICSMFMLPVNIIVYVNIAFRSLPKNQCDESDESASCEELGVDFEALGLTLGVVISAIILGLVFGYNFPKWQVRANQVGNVCGMASIILGLFFSQTSDNPPLEQPPVIWFSCLTPLLIALGFAFFVSYALGLPGPQRVAIAIETAYQNTGIAIAYGVTLGCEGRNALVVPVIYGGFEAVCFGAFSVLSWKLGYTYAPAFPKDRPNTIVNQFIYLWEVMKNSYQPMEGASSEDEGEDGKDGKPKVEVAAAAEL